MAFWNRKKKQQQAKGEGEVLQAKVEPKAQAEAPQEIELTWTAEDRIHDVHVGDIDAGFVTTADLTSAAGPAKVVSIAPGAPVDSAMAGVVAMFGRRAVLQWLEEQRISAAEIDQDLRLEEYETLRHQVEQIEATGVYLGGTSGMVRGLGENLDASSIWWNRTLGMIARTVLHYLSTSASVRDKAEFDLEQRLAESKRMETFLRKVDDAEGYDTQLLRLRLEDVRVGLGADAETWFNGVQRFWIAVAETFDTQILLDQRLKEEQIRAERRRLEEQTQEARRKLEAAARYQHQVKLHTPRVRVTQGGSILEHYPNGELWIRTRGSAGKKDGLVRFNTVRLSRIATDDQGFVLFYDTEDKVLGWAPADCADAVHDLLKPQMPDPIE